MSTRASIAIDTVPATAPRAGKSRPSSVVPLGAGTADDRDLGGKAASLNRLARLGRPIPPGFCLAASAYRAWIDAVVDRAAFAAAVAALPDEGARGEIADLLERTPTPAGVGEELKTALD